MITAEELRDARYRAGYASQKALAEALGVSERTIANWEQEGSHVSARSEAAVRKLLWPAPGPLSSYSNYELLSEIGRRLDWPHQPVRQPDYPETGGDDNDPASDRETLGSAHNIGTGRQLLGSSPAEADARGDNDKRGPGQKRGRGPRIT